MASRLKLHTELMNVLGNRNVYFQPPETLKMQYPCIRYQLDGADTSFADNMPYTFRRRYTLTLIDRNPDSEFIDKLAMAFPTIVLDRSYTTEGLNHYVYSLFY